MARVIAPVLTAAVLASPLVQPTQAAPKHEPLCPAPWWASGQRGIDAREHLIRCLADHREAPGSPRYVVGIGRCESGWDLKAPMDSDYSGTFQQDTQAWPGRLRSFQSYAGIRPHYIPPTNVRANTAVSIHMAKADGTWRDQWSCAA